MPGADSSGRHWHPSHILDHRRTFRILMILTCGFRNSYYGQDARAYCPQNPSRLRKNYCGMVEIQWPSRLGEQENRAQDAQKGRPTAGES